MTFYVAGHLAANHRAPELYPSPDARSFINSPFDKAAHALLPHLPKSTTGAYMYIPLVAGFFAPVSFLSPNLAMFIWQALSVLALGGCALLLARVTGGKPSELFSFVIPVRAGFFDSVGWPTRSGIWLIAPMSWLFFNSATAIFFSWDRLVFPFTETAIFRSRRIRCFGVRLWRPTPSSDWNDCVVCLLILSTVLFSWSVVFQWLLSHRVSDAYFFAGLQSIPSHLITGLPANVMILFPVHEREAVKLPLYTTAAFLWLFGLWFCVRLRKSSVNEPKQVSTALILGVVLASITSPHLLYYDLCVLLPAGVLLLAEKRPAPRCTGFHSIAVIGWITVSGFMPLLLGLANQKCHR